MYRLSRRRSLATCDRQMPISYLHADYEYCVTATYTRLEKPTYHGYTIEVQNHAENKDGKPLGPI